jgi:hypothetical protein
MKGTDRNFCAALLGAALMVFSITSTAAGAEPDYMRHDLDLGKYNKFRLSTLSMDNIQVLKPEWEDDPEPWTFNPGDREATQKLFRDIMTEELSKEGGYPVVNERGDDVITLEVELLSITPYVKPGTVAQQGDFVISTLGSGEVVVSAEFRDSVTRELLVLIEGERTIGDEYKEVNRENHEANVRKLFMTWGKNVRAAMDKAHGK